MGAVRVLFLFREMRVLARDMTKGNPAVELFWFSLPLVGSGLLQQLFQWADAFILGRAEGELALAALGSTATILSTLLLLITGLTQGVSLLAAQRFGDGRKEDLRPILRAFTLVLPLAMAAAGVVGILLADPILLLLKTPGEMFAVARDYMCFYLPGLPFAALYNVYAGVLRGMGDSKASFLAVMVSSVVNVMLDLLLVVVLPFGAAGAAAATAISQALMAIWVIWYTGQKYPFLRLREEKGALSATLLAAGLALGVPIALQQSIGSLTNLVLQRFMNGFGPSTVAAITTAYRVDVLIMLPIINLAAGISTMVAQNVGAGDRKRADQFLLWGMGMAAVCSLILTVFVSTLGGSCVALFGVGEEAVAIGGEFFRVIGRFYLLFGLSMALSGYLQGVGDVTFTGGANIFSRCVRIALSYAWAVWLGNMIIAWAEIASWALLVALYGLRFFQLRRRNRLSNPPGSCILKDES